jgi:hypothetical protein
LWTPPQPAEAVQLPAEKDEAPPPLAEPPPKFDTRTGGDPARTRAVRRCQDQLGRQIVRFTSFGATRPIVDAEVDDATLHDVQRIAEAFEAIRRGAPRRDLGDLEALLLRHRLHRAADHLRLI